MAEITAAAVRALRDRTDLPMMDCKKALVEADGNEDAAVEILKKSGRKATDKRKDNATSEGRFQILIADDNKSAALVELQCESAPVGKSDDFKYLAEQCAKQLLTGPGAATPGELLSQPVPDRPGLTLNELVEETTNKIREKMVVARVKKVSGKLVGGYVHHDGKTAVLFEAEGAKASGDILRDVAMHVASMRPKVTFPEQLPAEVVAAERDRLTAEAQASGKPAAVIEKMVDGRLKAFYEQQAVLVEQKFVKDDTKSVAQALNAAGLKASGYHRFVLGVE